MKEEGGEGVSKGRRYGEGMGSHPFVPSFSFSFVHCFHKFRPVTLFFLPWYLAANASGGGARTTSPPPGSLKQKKLMGTDKRNNALDFFLSIE